MRLYPEPTGGNTQIEHTQNCVERYKKVANNAYSNGATNKIKHPLKRLEELHRGVVLRMSAISVKGFSLYQKISFSALRVKWDISVDNICFMKDCLDDKGVKFTVTYGQP